MSNLLVTTSLTASNETKQKARQVARKLKGIFTLRGRKSLEDVVKRARKLGAERIAFVQEKNGVADKISFYEDGWREEIKIEQLEKNK